jgi:hypothetical protein
MKCVTQCGHKTVTQQSPDGKMGNAQARKRSFSANWFLRGQVPCGACEYKRIFASVVTSISALRVEWEKKGELLCGGGGVDEMTRYWFSHLRRIMGNRRRVEWVCSREKRRNCNSPLLFFNLMQTLQRRWQNKTERHVGSARKRLNVIAVMKRRRSSHILIGSCTNIKWMNFCTGKWDKLISTLAANPVSVCFVNVIVALANATYFLDIDIFCHCVFTIKKAFILKVSGRNCHECKEWILALEKINVLIF